MSKILLALIFCLVLFFSPTAVVRADGPVLLDRPFPKDQPLQSPTNIIIIGTVSWYGDDPKECLGCWTDLEGRFIMANGDLFDDSLSTIACSLVDSCSTIPLGTEVLIINLENGRRESAVVADTFGGYNDRIADLSKRLAECLGFLEEGVAFVMIEVIPETPVPNLVR